MKVFGADMDGEPCPEQIDGRERVFTAIEGTESESRYVDLADGARLHFEVGGTGPAVTLLHPGLWDMRAWDPQFEPWAARFPGIFRITDGTMATGTLTGPGLAETIRVMLVNNHRMCSFMSTEKIDALVEELKK